MHFDEKNDKFRGKFSFLSNLHSCPVPMPDGNTYPSSEAAFQAYKCLDMKDREQFLHMNGREAKLASHKVDLRPDWKDIRNDVMRQAIHSKFSNNPQLAEKLMATTGTLVENNTWRDTYWGRYQGHGQNMLGKMLMEERERLLSATRTKDDDVQKTPIQVRAKDGTIMDVRVHGDVKNINPEETYTLEWDAQGKYPEGKTQINGEKLQSIAIQPQNEIDALNDIIRQSIIAAKQDNPNKELS